MKKYIVVVLLFVIVISTAYSQCPSLGDGTATNPYQIATLTDFQNIYPCIAMISGGITYFILTDDIGTLTTPIMTPT
jgi:hypothetical protein